MNGKWIKYFFFKSIEIKWDLSKLKEGILIDTSDDELGK